MRQRSARPLDRAWRRTPSRGRNTPRSAPAQGGPHRRPPPHVQGHSTRTGWVAACACRRRRLGRMGHTARFVRLGGTPFDLPIGHGLRLARREKHHGGHSQLTPTKLERLAGLGCADRDLGVVASPTSTRWHTLGQQHVGQVRTMVQFGGCPGTGCLIHANRGVAGIDGCTSTALGWHAAKTRNTRRTPRG